MGKKDKKTNKTSSPSLPPPSEPLSPRGKKLAAAGGVLIVLGFLVLSRADALARNWAGHLAPFLILGGYALLGVGLYLPAPEPSSPPTPEA